MADNFRTNNPVTMIQDIQDAPLVDGHMHIQSNDIAPIPLMKGIFEKKFWEKDPLNPLPAKVINFYELTFREYSQFPQTDDISPKENTLSKGELDLSRKAMTNIAAGLPGQIAEYGKITRENSYHISGLYAGELLDTNLGIGSRRILKRYDGNNAETEEKDKDTSKKEREKILSHRNTGLNNFKTISRHYYNTEQAFLGRFRFSILHGMELLYAHYWGTYGIPIYIVYNKELYYVTNNLSVKFMVNSDLYEEDLQNVYDIPQSALRGRYKIRRNTALQNRNEYREITTFKEVQQLADTAPFGTDEAGSTERYSHFMKKADDSELCQFEDYFKHNLYTRMAVLNYPFKFLPFLHVDPRRIWGKLETGKHDFYCETGNNELEQLDKAKIKQNIDRNIGFRYAVSADELKRELLNGEEDNGLFWGVKLYAALGYPPYLSIDGEAKKVFPHIGTGTYQGWADFLKYCAEKEIPVTCHGSPQGMTIADPCVYLKEYLKQQKNSAYYRKKKICFESTGKTFFQGLGLIDDFSSPDSWEKTLNSLPNNAGNKLKLCLAHFGGVRYFSGEFRRNSPYDWIERICRLIKPGNNVFTDISCFTFEDITLPTNVIAETAYNKYCRTRGHSILERAYSRNQKRGSGYYTLNTAVNFTMAELAQLNKFLVDFAENEPLFSKLVTAAHTLATQISVRQILKHRILFGTDWPMTEMTVTGIPNYNACIFLLLQLVTKYCGGTWDAWHQFAVINPLRFLGLLKEEADGGPKENNYTGEFYTFNHDKMVRFNDHVTKYLDSIPYDFKDEADDKFKINLGNVRKNYTSVFKSKYDLRERGTKEITIRCSHMIKNREGKLILLDGYK
jgi:hypothetical protein